MLLITEEIRQRATELGQALGFAPTKEVWDSLLRFRLNKSYLPHIDLLWSLPLEPRQRAALSWALDRPLEDVTHLPVVGCEIQGATPSTKTMAADAANLVALGAPVGMLIVAQGSEEGIYRRAARVIRSLRRSFGDLHLLPMEAGWLEGLLEKSWPPGVSPIQTPRDRTGTGGEGQWAKGVRAELRRRGEDAGFTVEEDYRPPVLREAFRSARLLDSRRLIHTWDPLMRTTREMKKTGDYFTESKIDVAWLMPLPRALPAFLREILSLDRCLEQHEMVFPEIWGHVPVVVFELEQESGKHAGGGLLNLSAYGILGLAVTPSERVWKDVSRALETYRHTLGLRNVYVMKMSL